MRLEEERFAVSDGAVLYARHREPAPDSSSGAAIARLAVVHGYGEHSGRYEELMHYLVERGLACSALDLRGHGQSPGQRGHVRGFHQYVDDVSVFIERVESRSPGLPIVVLGHSLGGLVLLRALQSGAVRPRAAVLTNPLLALLPERKPVPDWFARALSKWLPRLPLPNGVRKGDLTHDPERLAALERDSTVHIWATPRWYWVTTLAGRQALHQAADVQVPLMLVLGTADPLVDVALARRLFERVAAQDKSLLLRDGELHEVLNEVRRRETFAQIFEFVARVASA